MQKLNLVCQNWVWQEILTKFLEFPFSSRHRRPETRPDLFPKTFFPLTRYLALVCICLEWIPSPEAKVISLPLPISILVQLPFTVALQHFKSALGYPTRGCRVDKRCVGYPNAPPSNCQPPSNWKCARPRGFTGRRVPGRPGDKIQCRQFVEVADCKARGWSRFHGKIPYFYIPYGFYRNFFSLSQKKFTSIFAKTEFWQKFGCKTKILCFRNDLWVLLISSSVYLINFPNFQIPLDFFL